MGYKKECGMPGQRYGWLAGMSEEDKEKARERINKYWEEVDKIVDDPDIQREVGLRVRTNNALTAKELYRNLGCEA